MFYSKEILTKKKGGFGVIWLAATLGNKSQFKKLSRKEVNGVNVSKACEFIVSPPEPLALRLTSNLMVGVARVYNQQYHFYYVDVNNVFAKLKRELASMQMEDIDMPVHEARADAITIEEDPEFVAEIERSVRRSMAKHSDSVVPDLAMDFGWAIRLHDDEQFRELGSGISSVPSITPRKETSTRGAFLLDDANPFDFAALSSYSGAMGEPLADAGTAAGFDEDIMMGDLGGEYERTCLVADEEGNLHVVPVDEPLAGVNEEDLLARVRDEHAEARGKRKRAAGPLEPEEDLEYRYQGDFSVSVDQDQGTAAMDIDQQGLSPPPPHHEPQDDHIVPIAPPAEERQTVKKQKQKRKNPFFDEITELAPHTNQNARDIVLAEYQNGRRAAEEKERKRIGKEFAANLMSMPSILLQAPALRRMWSAHASRPKPSRGGHKLQKFEAGHVGDDQDVAPHRASVADEQGEMFVGLDGDMFPFEPSFADAGREIDFEPEQARRGRASEENSQASVARAQGFVWNQVDWSGAGTGMASVGGKSAGGRSAGGRSTSADGGGSTGGRDFTFSTPMRRGARRSILPSSISPLARGRFGLDAGELGVTEFDVFGDEEAEEQMPFKEDDIRLAAMERDTANFMEYAKSLAHEANVDSIRFSELFPSGVVTSRSEAAQAFYHILALATRRIVKPEQDEAYGDIEVRFYV